MDNGSNIESVKQTVGRYMLEAQQGASDVIEAGGLGNLYTFFINRCELIQFRECEYGADFSEFAILGILMSLRSQISLIEKNTTDREFAGSLICLMDKMEIEYIKPMSDIVSKKISAMAQPFDFPGLRSKIDDSLENLCRLAGGLNRRRLSNLRVSFGRFWDENRIREYGMIALLDLMLVMKANIQLILDGVEDVGEIDPVLNSGLFDEIDFLEEYLMIALDSISQGLDVMISDHDLGQYANLL